MAEIERKEVKISREFELDLIFIYIYGEEVFGTIAAKSFIADIYSPESSGEFRLYVSASFGMQALAYKE